MTSLVDSSSITASVCLMTNSDAPNEGLTQAEQNYADPQEAEAPAAGSPEADASPVDQGNVPETVTNEPVTRNKVTEEGANHDATAEEQAVVPEEVVTPIQYINPPDEIAPEKGRRVPGPLINPANSVAAQQRQSSNLRDDDEA